MKMKRVTTILMLVAIVVMSSCSRQDDLPQTSGDVIKVTLRAQSPEVQTRAVGDIKRYIIEVYEGGDATTPANIFGEGENKTHHSELPEGSFTMDLKKNTKYTFLLWADNSAPNDNENGFYKAANLKAVEMNEAATTRAEAFCVALTQTVTSTSSLKVALGHAVAQMIYDNTMAFASTTNNSLQVTYPYSATFNVGTGKTVTTTEDVVRTFTIAAESTEATVGIIATDYIFAPDAEAKLATLKMVTTIDGEAEKERTVTNVPIQLNYTTRIKGAFSDLLYDTSFNVSSSVEDMEEQDHQF